MWSIAKSNTEGRAFMTLTIVFLVLAFLTFALRIYSRWLNEASSTLDASDYFCGAAVVSLLYLDVLVVRFANVAEVLDVGLVVVSWGAFAHGWGEEVSHFTLADARNAAWTFVSFEIVWHAATVAVRISMLLLYIRIFQVRRFRQICWIITGINVAIFVSVVLSTCLICRPIAYSFDKTIPNGKCGDLDGFENYTAIISLLADCTIVILPMPMLWRLQMKTRRKVGISIVLGMGIIICALTLTRVLALHFYHVRDHSKEAAVIGLITGLEPIIGVMNACLPFLPLVFKRIAQSQFFLNASASLRSFSKRTNRSYLAFAKVNDSGPTKGLKEVEMSAVETRTCGNGNGKTYVSTGSQNSIPESGPWDGLNGFRRQDHIFVRQDISVV